MSNNDTVSKRVDALGIIEADKSNPNGSSDSDGAPRECNGMGVITDKSIKRKIRDILEDHDSPIFRDIMAKAGIEEKDFRYYEVLESFSRGFNTSDPVEAKNELKKLYLKDPKEACQKYADVRLFGCTFLDEQGKRGEKIRFVRSGVVQLGCGYSIAPIITETMSITRKVNTEDEKAEGGGMAPGAIKLVDHALYAFRISVNPSYARRTETTNRDIELLKCVLPYTFSATESTSRPAGSVNIVHLWWADHTNSIGSFNANNLFDKLMPRKKNDPDRPSRSLEDYDIPEYTGNEIKVIDLMKF